MGKEKHHILDENTNEGAWSNWTTDGMVHALLFKYLIWLCGHSFGTA